MAYPTCRIKNISGSQLTIRGQVLENNEIFLIPDIDRLFWINDDAVLTAITSDEIQVGDANTFYTIYSDQFDALKITKQVLQIQGGTDSTIVGNTGNSLKVTSDLEIPSAVTGLPVISNNLKIEYTDTEISLGLDYATLYNYSGSGKFFGTVLNFNSNKVMIKCTIDSNVIFEMSIQTIEDIARFGGNKSGCDRDMCHFFRVGSSDRIEFCPPAPIAYSTNIKFEAKRNNTSSNRKLQERVIFLTKES